jgi:uncharacterized protein (TIGR02466 family)
MNIQLDNLFPTPVFSCDTELDCAPIKDYINKLNKDYVIKSNVGGRQTDFLTSEELGAEELKPLFAFIAELAEAIGKEMPAIQTNMIESVWVNFSSKGNTNLRHVHGNSVLSGVFYVDVPQGSGNLIVERADNAGLVWNMDNRTPQTCESQQYVATTGKLILFPSWLPHRVTETFCEDTRISISFNLTFKK